MRDVYFMVRRLQRKRDYFWEYRYTRKELAGFIEETGFKVIDVDIDDYIEEDTIHHIGLYADFFFLRSQKGELWELNTVGKLLLRIGKLFSPWLFCSGLHMVAVKKMKMVKDC